MSECCKNKHKTDYLFWSTFIISIIGYVLYISNPPVFQYVPHLKEFCGSVYEFINKMWWGLLLGMLFVGLLGVVPKDVIINVLGRKRNTASIVRAAIAGILLDLCSHGILLVSMKLYERGVRLSQVVAFLVASPWNSLSLTVILIAFIGWKWTLLYIVLSMLIAIVSGMIIELCVAKNILPDNPNYIELDEDFSTWESLKNEFKGKKISEMFSHKLLIQSFMESEMILRWIFMGVIIAGLVRTFVDTSTFSVFFGPTVAGLFFTLIAATIIEVCSEGSVPIAYDLFTRAAAPGNAFLFLMAGASTDYTEIMALRETTKSWKIAFFLPLVTVPQILVISYILNNIK